MNNRLPHCFLLDGKNLLPIEGDYQLCIPLKFIPIAETVVAQCPSEKNQSRVSFLKNRTENENDRCLDQSETVPISSRRILRGKRRTTVNDKSRSIDPINNSQKHYIQTDRYPIHHLLPSINLSIDSPLTPNKSQINIKQSNESPFALTITIEPFVSHAILENKIVENHSTTRAAINRKRLASSLSLTQMTKHLSSTLSNQTIQTVFYPVTSTEKPPLARWSTLKDLERKSPSMTEVSTTPSSTHFLPSGTLLDLYRHRKQQQQQDNAE